MNGQKGFKIKNQTGIYFVTFGVCGGIDIFTNRLYCDLLVENLQYRQENSGLKIYGWCLMSNHIHLIISTPVGKLSGVIRDFKKYSSKKLTSAIECNAFERRKSWIIPLLFDYGQKNTRNKNFQFWQQYNCPKEIISEYFFYQKLNYVHMNPVKKGLVDSPENYIYSSARNYAGKEGVLKIQSPF